jgi:hypothetical protein
MEIDYCKDSLNIVNYYLNGNSMDSEIVIFPTLFPTFLVNINGKPGKVKEKKIVVTI